MIKSNRTPFTDRVQLVNVQEVPDSSGYVTKTETPREVFCSFSLGVNRTEYYESMKAGVKLSATAEIWELDYAEEQLLDYGGKRYKIIRVWPTGTGLLQLYLEEVVR